MEPVARRCRGMVARYCVFEFGRQMPGMGQHAARKGMRGTVFFHFINRYGSVPAGIRRPFHAPGIADRKRKLSDVMDDSG